MLMHSTLMPTRLANSQTLNLGFPARLQVDGGPQPAAPHARRDHHLLLRHLDPAHRCRLLLRPPSGWLQCKSSSASFNATQCAMVLAALGMAAPDRQHHSRYRPAESVTEMAPKVGNSKQLMTLLCPLRPRSVPRQRLFRGPAGGAAGQGGPLPHPPLRRQLRAGPGELRVPSTPNAPSNAAGFSLSEKELSVSQQNARW
jgi:hypothetical protein